MMWTFMWQAPIREWCRRRYSPISPDAMCPLDLPSFLFRILDLSENIHGGVRSLFRASKLFAVWSVSRQSICRTAHMRMPIPSYGTSTIQRLLQTLWSVTRSARWISWSALSGLCSTMLGGHFRPPRSPNTWKAKTAPLIMRQYTVSWEPGECLHHTPLFPA